MHKGAPQRVALCVFLPGTHGILWMWAHKLTGKVRLSLKDSNTPAPGWEFHPLPQKAASEVTAWFLERADTHIPWSPRLSHDLDAVLASLNFPRMTREALLTHPIFCK